MENERKHVFFKVICESHFQEKATLNTLIKIHLSHSEFIPLSHSLSESLYHSIRVDQVVCILIPCQQGQTCILTFSCPDAPRRELYPQLKLILATFLKETGD